VDVLAVQDNATLEGVTDTPVPETVIVEGEFVALLAMLALPLINPAAVGANWAVNVADWVGVKISPEVKPLALKPPPDTLTFEIVTFELPLLVTVTFNELLLPTFTFPKDRLEALSPRTWVAATPVPLREIVSGELGALLARVIDPLTLPAALGPNTALNVEVLPGAMLSGTVSPVVLKPAPVTAAEEIVRVAVPLFARLMVCELFDPVTTLPNAAVDGVAASCGCVAFPLNGIVSGEVGALLTTEMLPLILPAEVGANW
jgi:hypothetical protein